MCKPKRCSFHSAKHWIKEFKFSLFSCTLLQRIKSYPSFLMSKSYTFYIILSAILQHRHIFYFTFNARPIYVSFLTFLVLITHTAYCDVLIVCPTQKLDRIKSSIIYPFFGGMQILRSHQVFIGKIQIGKNIYSPVSCQSTSVNGVAICQELSFANCLLYICFVSKDHFSAKTFQEVEVTLSFSIRE